MWGMQKSLAMLTPKSVKVQNVLYSIKSNDGTISVSILSTDNVIKNNYVGIFLE